MNQHLLKLIYKKVNNIVELMIQITVHFDV